MNPLWDSRLGRNLSRTVFQPGRTWMSRVSAQQSRNRTHLGCRCTESVSSSFHQTLKPWAKATESFARRAVGDQTLAKA